MENKIHPTAIIDTKAELEGVNVLAYVIVEAGVKVKKGTCLQAHCHLKKGTQIGENNVIGEKSIIGGEGQDRKFDSKIPTGVVLGNRNVIRECVTIHRATLEGKNTTLGDDNYLMACSHLGHDVKIENHVTIANGFLAGGFCTIGEGAFLSGVSVLHQHVRVGRYAMMGALSKVVQDVLPFSLVSGHFLKGINVVGLRRAGFSLQDRNTIKKATETLSTVRDLKEALSFLKKEEETKPLVKEMILFCQQSERGILRRKEFGKLTS